MKVLSKCNGVTTEHEVSGVPFMAIVHQTGIKVEAPDAFLIDSKATRECMEKMSQAAWVHISTGELFNYLFDLLFKDMAVSLPERVSVLLEDYDDGVIHGCGLIILLVESMFEKRPEVFLKNPENNLHPSVVCRLVTVFLKIQQLGGPAINTDLQSVGL